MKTAKEIIEKFKQKNIRALAKAITFVENNYEGYEQILKEIYPETGKAHVIGITGSPGAGKSSLIDLLISHLRKKNIKVGVIAVDPSSPFTGGAILGDRIRMIKHSTDKGTYIRSMANRGQTGGLNIATSNTVKLLDAFGFEVIIIETVGVGQTEVDIACNSDTVTVVINPETGDHIQAIKAGIMEIADVFVVNKQDLPGATRTKLEIENVIQDINHDQSWQVPVAMTSTLKETGIDDLWEGINNHFNHIKSNKEIEKIRLKNLESEIVTLLEFKLKNILHKSLLEEENKQTINKANNKEINVIEAVDKILNKII